MIAPDKSRSIRIAFGRVALRLHGSQPGADPRGAGGGPRHVRRLEAARGRPASARRPAAVLHAGHALDSRGRRSPSGSTRSIRPCTRRGHPGDTFAATMDLAAIIGLDGQSLASGSSLAQMTRPERCLPGSIRVVSRSIQRADRVVRRPPVSTTLDGTTAPAQTTWWPRFADTVWIRRCCWPTPDRPSTSAILRSSSNAWSEPRTTPLETFTLLVRPTN